MPVGQNIISILTNENSKKVLLSLLKSENSAQELSSKLEIPLSTTYRIINNLENEKLISVSKMVLNSEGHHVKIYNAKIYKIILTIDSEDIKVQYMVKESEKLRDIWKKLSDSA